MTLQIFVIQNQTTQAFFRGQASVLGWTFDISKARLFANENQAVYYRDNLQALGADVRLVALTDTKTVASKLDCQKLDADFDAWYQELAKDLPFYLNPQTRAACWLTWKAASRNAVGQQTQTAPTPTPYKVYPAAPTNAYSTFDDAVNYAKSIGIGRTAAIMEYPDSAWPTGYKFKAGWYRVNLDDVSLFKEHGFILRAVLELQVNTNI